MTFTFLLFEMMVCYSILRTVSHLCRQLYNFYFFTFFVNTVSSVEDSLQNENTPIPLSKRRRIFKPVYPSEAFRPLARGEWLQFLAI